MKYIIYLLLIGIVFMCGCVGNEVITMNGKPIQILPPTQSDQKSDIPVSKVITIVDLDRDVTTNGLSSYACTIYYVIDSDNNIYSLGVPFYQNDVSRYTLYRTLKKNTSYNIEYQYDNSIEINDITSISEVK